MNDPLGMFRDGAIAAVFQRVPSIEKAVVFGSRAKGTHTQYSDVDIALFGEVGLLEVEEVRCELDELPLIYKFDVVAYNRIENVELRGHIDRVGVAVYERNLK